MARLRHFVISVGLLACLCSCGRSEPLQPAIKPAPGHKPTASVRAAPVIQVVPSWQSRVPVIEPAQVAETLLQADGALARGQLERGGSPGPGALELYLAVVAVDAGNAQAQAGVQSALDALLERGRIAMRAGRLADADRIDLITGSLLPGHPDLPVYKLRLTDARLAATWVAKANRAGTLGHFLAPAGHSVSDYLARAQKAFSDFEPVETSRHRWNLQLIKRALRAANREDFTDADRWLLQSARLFPASSDARVADLRIVELRQSRTDAVAAAGNLAVDGLQLDRADVALAHLQRIAAQPGLAGALRQRIHIARHYGPFQPRQVFSEKLAGGGMAPEMIVIPFGQFQMGASDDDPQRQDNELPRHDVVFRRGFAIARNELTVGDFKRFIDSSHYLTTATRAGHSTVYDEKGGVFSEHEGVDWRRDHVGRIASPALPVVHITLQDALAYTRWLSKQTGRQYRLPSEAEFEYVLRAGGKYIYPWGDSAPRRVVGNLPGDGDLSSVGRSWGNAIPGYRDAFWGPAPVRNFPPERFGTFDMVGNVSEWTLDCWHDSYLRAPVNGSAWINPGCISRAVRGASWGSSLDQVRSASRLPMDAGSSTARLGFRVVREI